MTLEALDNLVKTGKLKTEPPDQNEFNGLLDAARFQLQDSQLANLTEHSRFSLADFLWHMAQPTHRHGYRSENRYMGFQCLQYTVGMETAKWHVLDKCHKQRNLAEYEGHLDITPQLLQELIAVTEEALEAVEALGPVR